jgi:(2R)-sulfolactate sulfo-lyase subunit alpha
MTRGILLHEAEDDVGVAALDLRAGDVVEALTLDGASIDRVEIVDDVPLAHKVAMRPIDAGADVVEYGRAIGAASRTIARGAHVHTHNLRSNRWSGRSQIVEHGEEVSS